MSAAVLMIIAILTMDKAYKIIIMDYKIMDRPIIYLSQDSTSY